MEKIPVKWIIRRLDRFEMDNDWNKHEALLELFYAWLDAKDAKFDWYSDNNNLKEKDAEFIPIDWIFNEFPKVNNYIDIFNYEVDYWRKENE